MLWATQFVLLVISVLFAVPRSYVWGGGRRAGRCMVTGISGLAGGAAGRVEHVGCQTVRTKNKWSKTVLPWMVFNRYLNPLSEDSAGASRATVNKDK